MSDNNLRAARGHLVVFSTGEYSDFGYRGHFVAIDDVTAADFELAKETANKRFAESEARCDAWTKESGEPYPGWLNIHEAFIAALISQGKLISVNVVEHHIGSYGELEV